MKGYMLGNMDIELYLTSEEIEHLMLTKKYISVKLKDVHELGVNRKVTLSLEDSINFTDGIKVELIHPKNKKECDYHVKINTRALQKLEENDGVWGSRYGLGEKIILSTKQPCWDRMPK